MNGKQARMLRQMKTSKKERKQWRLLSAETKGELRRFHESIKGQYGEVPEVFRWALAAALKTTPGG